MATTAGSDVMLMTPAEFLEYPLPKESGDVELVRGEVRVTPAPGGPHGCAVTNFVVLLSGYVKARNLGRVFADGVGYELVRLPHTVRVPDASFVRAGRLPPEGVRAGFLRLAPDLAVEVLSPSDTAAALEEKVSDYFEAGTSLIWVADPVRRRVSAYAVDGRVRRLHETDVLDGGDVIPGFSCAVAEVFDGIARDLSNAATED
ncbi:MAG TPA: Uma2 family endonuclease [Gemmatimonadaceae bacterium]|nr:Uma2 family endonuclease [Gemmatimonadaceae bacterium]